MFAGVRGSMRSLLLFSCMFRKIKGAGKMESEQLHFFTAPFFSSSCIVYLYDANATIPEIHGCARAYEMTGEEQYRKVVENY